MVPVPRRQCVQPAAPFALTGFLASRSPAGPSSPQICSGFRSLQGFLQGRVRPQRKLKANSTAESELCFEQVFSRE